MGSIDIEAAKNAIREVLVDGQRKGELKLLTVRIVLQKVEKELGLEENALMDGEHKKTLRAFIKEESSRVREASDVEKDTADEPESFAKPSSSAKQKSDAGPSSLSKKRGKSADSDIEERQDRSRSKPSSTKNEDKNTVSASTDAKRRGSFKSKDTIDSDTDMEGAGRKEPTGSKVSVSVSSNTTKGTKRKSHAAKEGETPDSKVSSKKPKERCSEEKGQSDSELSVLMDEPPSKRSKGKKSEGKSRPKKSESSLSPDEEQIKKLKSLIVACGVRKVWAKELKDCETTSSQISHLRRLLSDLGMKGRYSIEQAKSIRAKRELAQELEDVKVFAEKHSNDRRKRAPTAPGKKQDDAESGASDDNDDEDENAHPRKRKNAHASIMAFLGDQSDSD